MPTTTIQINRAPVLTLWATVVAERLGYDREAALTLGKAVAGLNAQSKGRRLGIYEEQPESAQKKKPPKKSAGKTITVTLLHRPVPAVRTPQGLRATAKDQPIEPQSVQRYLDRSFGKHLVEAQQALEELAGAYPPDRLADSLRFIRTFFDPPFLKALKAGAPRALSNLTRSGRWPNTPADETSFRSPHFRRAKHAASCSPPLPLTRISFPEFVLIRHGAARQL